MGKSVVIIGGGIAGLGAAYDLVKSGLRVTVLEAKSRFGGRIHTLHQGGFPIELGAEFIHGRNPEFFKLVRAAKLAIHEAPDSQFEFKNGSLKESDFWDQVGEVIEKVDSEKRDRSFARFLDGQNLNQPIYRLAKAFAEGFDAAHADQISAQAMLKAQRAAEKMDGDWQGRMTKGYSAIIDFLCNRIRDGMGQLVAGARVREVKWKRGTVEIDWTCGEITNQTTADAAIVTLPLGVLKAGTVRFDSPIRSKAKTIQKLKFGNVIKVGLVFRRRWWSRKQTGIIQALDEALPTWWSDSRGPVLTGWAGGPKADSLIRLPQKQLTTLCINIAAKLFSRSASSLRKLLVAMYCYRWDADPDFGGAYSYIPVNGMDLPVQLAKPIDGTLFFAGEATVLDGQTGTVFGAYESGLRAAREILRLK